MKLFLPLFFLLALFASCKKKTLFEQISSSHSLIDFNNEIVETDSINPLDMVNIYNGGGVGIGDFNRDGLADIYFTGNRVSNKMYLNKGDFVFEDITEKAGVTGEGRWGRGVAVVDINNDGWPDVYVCNTLYADSLKRQNLLYINQKNDKNGIPHFKESAKEYGLDIRVQSTMANFFDYDNDGDLDMYLVVNAASTGEDQLRFGARNNNADNRSTGKLYRNDLDTKKRHPVYHDVSRQAGIVFDGYGHSATVVDLNGDGWREIYVANDFLSENILYINNKNGTFTNRAKEYFKHTSYNAMGVDITDINNDGLADVYELDMNPEDNYRKKMMLNANSNQTYQNFDLYGYQYQYVRNTLQLNRGPRPAENDSIGAPVFSDIGFMSGTAQTDWSWTPLITDFDNDGFRDIVVTNGFPRDVTDHDFITYRQEAYAVASKKKVLEQIPVVKLHNYAFKNKGDLTFNDATKNWGLSEPSFSNGAVYADLNNDGAMDMVLNNINDKAFIYKNTLRENDPQNNHFLQVKLEGSAGNRDGFGAFIQLFYGQNKQQIVENTPYRGYLSSMQNRAHFGLGKINKVDSVVIKWPDGKKQVIANVKTDRILIVKNTDARQTHSSKTTYSAPPLFSDVTKKLGIKYKHWEFDFIDFTIQKLLPHKLSEYSPALSAADLNGDGLEDMMLGGNSEFPAQLLLQQQNGQFAQKAFNSADSNLTKGYKDEGILLFDADGDGDNDVYIASGGYKMEAGSPAYADRFYVNDGKAHFTRQKDALPTNSTSKICVRAVDYDKDGKLDIFVSGRVLPWAYPKPVSSFILHNESKNGRVKFTDVTKTVAPSLLNIGLVCDALFTDFDNDKWPDLILAGEWMPVTFLKNVNGKYQNVTAKTGLADKSGWWNSIVAADFRHTGRMDYIVGNTGRNTLYQPDNNQPVHITAKDFDGNGSFAAIPSYYLIDKNGDKKEFPGPGRDDILKQMISLKKKFTNYKSYATATMDEVLSPEQRKGALHLTANTLTSAYIRNNGNGKFSMEALPNEAQISVLNGMVADDFDGDGNTDVLLNGNDYGTDVSIGRYDALNGLLLKGNGKGKFSPQSIMQSGIYIPGNGKALVNLPGKNGSYLVAASQNKDVMKVFSLKRNGVFIPVKPDDASSMITHKNGTKTRQEFYYGSSFLSQSGRFIFADKNTSAISITNIKGQTRTVPVSHLSK